MTLEEREYTDTAGAQATVATECRYCGEPIPEGKGYAEHFIDDCEDSPIQGGDA